MAEARTEQQAPTEPAAAGAIASAGSEGDAGTEQASAISLDDACVTAASIRRNITSLLVEYDRLLAFAKWVLSDPDAPYDFKMHEVAEAQDLVSDAVDQDGRALFSPWMLEAFKRRGIE